MLCILLSFGPVYRPMMVPLVALHPRCESGCIGELVGRPRPGDGVPSFRYRRNSLSWPISWVECIGPRLRVRRFTRRHTRVNDVFMTRSSLEGIHILLMGMFVDDYAAIFSQQCGPMSPSKRLYYSIGTSHMAASGNPWF